ncbi:MAG: Hpt domain-containing protein, partial [Verrucomicrobia bacterium]|nr:Hpt domain-containing protein [Verrucomicrobiota bacterium]
MLELFRVETESQVAVLTAGLLELERAPVAAPVLEALMRAAHSLKGAARIVHLPGIAQVAHALEDCFVAAQQGKLRLGKGEIDVLLRGVDFFTQIARATESDITEWETMRTEIAAGIIASLQALGGEQKPAPVAPVAAEQGALPENAPAVAAENPGRVVRIPAERVTRLLGLAGESLVESRRLQPFTVSMQRLKRLQ